MKNSLVRGVGLAAAALMVFGSAPAGAVNEFNGLTYAKAQESVSSWGGTLVIATREGSYLPTEQCIIQGTKKMSGKWMVDLNCNAPTAYDGHPGNSVATPEGQKVMKRRELAKQLDKNYEDSLAAGQTPSCGQDDTYREWCTRVCTEAGNCSDELLEYLGI